MLIDEYENDENVKGGIEIDIVNEISSDENIKVLETLKKEKVAKVSELRKVEKEVPKETYNLDSDEEETQIKITSSEFQAQKRRETK